MCSYKVIIDHNICIRSAFYPYFPPHRPTLLCSGRRWRGPWAGRDFCRSCRAASRAGLWRLPAAPLKAGVGRQPLPVRYSCVKISKNVRYISIIIHVWRHQRMCPIVQPSFPREDTKERALSFSHRSRVKTPKNMPYLSVVFFAWSYQRACHIFQSFFRVKTLKNVPYLSAIIHAWRHQKTCHIVQPSFPREDTKERAI